MFQTKTQSRKENKAMNKKNQDNTTPDEFAFPKAWTLFGPVGKDESEPEFAGMNAIPNELAIAGKKLAAQKAAFADDNRLDLGALLGGKEVGKTAYLLAVIEAVKAMEVELGAGADYWMKWWVNGEVVCDTMATGNGPNWPPSCADHRFTTRLKAGRNLVAVKVVSGSGGFVLAAGGPREMRAEVEIRKERDSLKAEESRRIGREIVERRQAAEARAQAELEGRTRIEVSATGASASGAGARYQATVPDTLDLAERAALAVNALTGAADPGRDYETAACANLHANPPYLSYRGGATCHPKVVQVLPQMRLMSGSTLRADYDEPITEWAVRKVEADGLWWLKADEAPWDKDFFQEDINCACAHNRLMVALLDRHQVDGNSRWLEVVGRMAEGRARIVNWSDDGERAWTFFYRNRAGWREDSGISNECRLSRSKPSDIEPQVMRAYPEIYTNGYNLRGFARWYGVSGDPKIRRVADGIARFMMKAFRGQDPADWPSMIAGREHGFWDGHFHSCTMALIGLAEYAVATGDPEAARCVRGAYEYARVHGNARLGFFPAVIGPLPDMLKQCRGDLYGPRAGMPMEGCCIGDMTYLAVLLSEAGLADYWEDVDQYVRNHLVEHQWTDRALMKAVVAAHPEAKPDPLLRWAGEEVLDRLVGGFTSITDPTWAYGWYTQCCNGNIPQGLYKAWAGIVRPQGENGVQVNLLLNRASPWLDVDSHLPYEGKVALRNKTARSASVRVPRWVNRAKVCCRVGAVERPAVWLNNYLLVRDLAPGDTVTIEFPMVTTVERWTEKTYETTYTCEFRGNTLVDISPRGERPSRIQDGSDDGSTFPVNVGYPIYRRDHMKTDRAPMKTVERYVAPRVV